MRLRSATGRECERFARKCCNTGIRHYDAGAVLAHEGSCMPGLLDSAEAPRLTILRNVLLLSGLPDAVGSLHRKISELHTQPTVPAVQRFRCSLTVALTWLRGQGGSLCFP